MKKNKVGTNIIAKNSSWTFSGNVAKNFDKHIDKSVPLYGWSHDLGLKLSDFFVKKNSKVHDLGCSTGTFVKKLNNRHKNKKILIKGYDIEKKMVKAAKKNNHKFKNIKIELKDIYKANLKKSDFITSFYTVQFIHPSKRQKIFNKIFKELNWGGGFLFFEKVRAPDARFQDMMSLIYNDFKLDNNFSPNEIIAKSRSLKGVLEPFSSKANIELLKRAGFKDITTVFKFICFEGFLAIK
jgi:tRNA (cmo5U34)-methyltransferase